MISDLITDGSGERALGEVIAVCLEHAELLSLTGAMPPGYTRLACAAVRDLSEAVKKVEKLAKIADEFLSAEGI